MSFKIRLAAPSDANAIADHLCRAGGGLMEFLLDGIVPDVKPPQLLALSLTEADETISYKNALVVDTDEGVKGLLLAYPLSEFHISTQMETFVDQGRLDHVRELYTHKIENSYYVHALSVDDTLAGQGAGRALLDLAYEIAADEGFGNVSLHVWRDNERALRLYQKNDFKVVRDIKIDRRDLLPHDGGMILMRHDLG